MSKEFITKQKPVSLIGTKTKNSKLNLNFDYKRNMFIKNGCQAEQDLLKSLSSNYAAASIIFRLDYIRYSFISSQILIFI